MLYPYISLCVHTRASIHKHAAMLWFVVIVYIHILAISHENYLLMAVEIQWIVWHLCNVQLAWLMFLLVYDSVMTMPWLRNPFRISCTLSEEITLGWLIPLTKGQKWRDIMFSLMLATRTSCWTNNRIIGDLRRYDVLVTVIKLLMARVEPLSYTTRIFNTLSSGDACMSVSQG